MTKIVKSSKTSFRELNAARSGNGEKLTRPSAAFGQLEVLNAVLEHIKRNRILSEAFQLLWTTAKFSTDYKVITWGIALGSLGENNEEQVRDLLIFVRHPEFTLYSTYAIRRMAAAKIMGEFRWRWPLPLPET